MTAAPLVAVTRPARPYPGLRPFEKDEWAIFFGRERMIDEVIGRLAESQLVLIHGVSGSGKSSLVRAGVLPKLALQYSRHDAPWLTCAMRPSGGPLWNLAAELARLEGSGGDLERVSAIAGRFNARSATLASVAASLEGVVGKSVCILVDQCEELFRYEKDVSRDEAELFVDLVARAAAREGGKAEPNRVDLHVIITMRSEFLGECARFAGFAETINRAQYLVPRIDDDGLMRAVRRPAQMYGAEFDEGLAERLIASVRGREDELPLLQHGLMLMWEEARPARSGERVALDGAIVDKAGGLTELLSEHADKVMASVVAPDEGRAAIVEAAFRALTDINTEGQAIRRPVAFQKLCAVTGATPDVLRPILDAFRAPGVSFVTPYAPQPIDDKTVIDVSHEALIRSWRKINAKDGWLQKEVRDGVAWRTLLFQAETFASDEPNYLSPAMTEAAVSLLAQRNEAWAERHGGEWAKVEALVDASRAHWTQEAAREKANRQKEIENERLRAEAAEHKAQEQQMLRDEERLRADAAEQAELLAKKSELLARRSAQRSWLVVVLVFIGGTLVAISIAAFWNRSLLKEEIYQLAGNVSPLMTTQGLKAGKSFKECRDCPEMIVAPAGRFLMGSPAGQGSDNERPQHEVKIATPFAVAKFALTFEEWDACVSYGDCDPRVGDSGWGRGRRPAIHVTWDDAQTYVRWLSRITGKEYRLLSEAEYEYAARAGTETNYPWGEDIKLDGRAMANCRGCGSPWDGEWTAPVCGGEEGDKRMLLVCEFTANRFGLYDMVGNVSEWTEDCWHDNYEGAPADGSPWTSGDCGTRVVRGGSWDDYILFLRSAVRSGAAADVRVGYFGFRVARTLGP